MNDYLYDMKNGKKTRHHQSLIRFFSKGDSKEYTNVKNALSDVEEYTSRNFVNDAELNSQIMNHAAKSYHRLIMPAGHILKKRAENRMWAVHVRKKSDRF